MLTAFLCLGLTAAPPSPQDSGSPWPSQRPTEGTTPAEWVQELESALRSHDDRLAVDAMVRLSGASHDLRDTDLGKTAARAVETFGRAHARDEDDDREQPRERERVGPLREKRNPGSKGHDAEAEPHRAMEAGHGDRSRPGACR